MKILDLFCGAGGASMGIHLAGHEVEGVDIDYKRQFNYPFKFNLDDATTFDLSGYDAYFASPPCQHFSYATSQWRNLGNEYPDLIAEMRERLLNTGKPFVLENVVTAPLRKDLTLCFGMFDDGSRKFIVRRHRVFEIHGFEVPQPEHIKHTGKVGDGRVISVFGHGGGVRYGNGSCKIEDWKEAMGMNWVSAPDARRCLSEAIPPEYTKYIFSFLK